MILATATGCANDPLPEATRHAGPGTTSAIYMGVRQARRIAAGLMAKGLPEDAPVQVVVEASKPGEMVLETPVGGLAQTLQAHGIRGCALIVIKWPKTGAIARPEPVQSMRASTQPAAVAMHL